MSLSAQLNPGDVMIVALNTDSRDGTAAALANCGDGFAFVALVEIPANTPILFTENEYQSTAFTTGEGTITWSNPAITPAGTVVQMITHSSNSSGCSVSAGASVGTFSFVGADQWGLGTSGEEIYVFTGSLAAPTLISAIITDNTDTGTSANTFPAGFSQFVVDLSPLGINADLAIMTSGLGCSSQAACVAAITDVLTNWTIEDSTMPNECCDADGLDYPQDIPGNFTIGAACTDPTFDTGLSQNPAGNPCPTASVNILIDGDLGTNTEGWFLRTGSATGPVIQGPAVTSQFTISGIQETTTYFVTAAFCSGPGQIPASITITTNGTAAMAGPDQLNLPGPSEFLAGSNPSPGTGMWTELSGDGNGVFGDATSPTSTFSGTPGVTYTLRWTVTNSPCATTMDDVLVSFAGGAPALTPGDLAFTGFQSDGTDEFAFVLLTDVPNGTVINFTDNGWLSAGSFRTGEGVVSLTLNADLNCGTEIRYDGTNFLTAAGASAGTATNVTGSLGLSTSGDQLFAFLGSLASPDLIAGINFDGTGWAADATSTNTSALPAVLAGNNALTLNEVDNGKYNCSVRAGEPDDIRAGINDPANWNVANDLGDPAVVIAEACSFTCGACVPAQLNSFGTSSTGTVCAGEAILLSINGTLNDADRWVVTFGGTVVGESTTNSLTFIPEVTGNYVLTSIDGCPGQEASLNTDITVNGALAMITGDEIQKVAGTLQDLEGNTYDNGTAGVWAFVDNPDGLGVIDDPNAANTSLTGTPGQGYTVSYTITPAGCPASTDEVRIVFTDETPLALGDIAFVGYNSDADGNGDDGFSFVVLKDVNAGTSITFNENGWLAAGGFRGTGEGVATVELCGFYSCGTEFVVLSNSETIIYDTDGNIAGTVTGGPIQLSTSGDQVFAYQGATPTAGDMSTFLAAIQMNGAWDANGDDTNTSAQPTVFSMNPGTSVAISPEVDNAVFDCANAPTVVNEANSLAAINNAANWTTNDNTALTLPIDCDDLGCCEAAVITSVNSDANNICPGDQVTLTVDGDLGGGATWVWYDICPSGAASTPTMLGTTFITVAPPSTTTFFVRAEGGCLDNEDCQSITIIVDAVLPDALCQDIEVFLDDNGMVTVDSNAIDNGSTDNCGIAEFSLTPNMFECDDVGSPTRALMTITDNSGNQDTCSALITVRDTTPPVIVCQNVTLNIQADGDTLINVFTIGAIVSRSDNCALVGNVGIGGIANNGLFTCAEIGDNSIDIFQEDLSGNITSCNVVITLTDDDMICNQPPVAVCVAPLTVDADANCEAVITAAEFDGGSSDPDGDMLTFSVDPVGPYDIGETEVTLTVSDGIAMSQCTTTVTVNDVTPPTITCTEFEFNFSDCPDGLGQFTPNGSFASLSAAGTIQLQVREVFTLDLSGCVDDNCSELGDLDISLAKSTIVSRVDGCSIEYLNKYLLRDGAGNVSPDSISTRVMVSFDGDPPVITCPADSLIDCGVVPTVMASDATATSGCGTPVVTVAGPAIVGEPNTAGTTYTFTFTATDGCGQTTTCNQVFTVQDTTAPVIVCEAITVALDSMGMAMIANDDAVVSITDNCEGTVSGPFTMGGPSARTFDCSFVGTTVQRTVVATDMSGNRGECTYDVTLIDTIAPIIVCEAITVAIGADGTAMIENDDAVVSIDDNCDMDPSGPFTVGGPINGRTFDCSFVGSTVQRTVVATDMSGNRGECTYDVTIVDEIPPTLECPAELTVYLDENGADTLRNNEWDFTELDNCDMSLQGPLVVGGPTQRQFDCSQIGTV
ncbi:hypothetical protein, partial [Neolewinella persica]|uniref:hypothetical protein n=1 Tax=Neolewinella persica TaxID=70998 RepID=UPI0012F7A6A9